MRRCFCFLMGILTAAALAWSGSSDPVSAVEGALAGYAEIQTSPDMAVNAPVMVREVLTRAERAGFEASNRAAVVILCFRAGEIVFDEERFSAEEILSGSAFKGKVIPALEIASQEDADALIAFVQTSGLEDAYVMSEQPELVGAVRAACPNLVGIWDARETVISDEISVRDTLNRNLAKIALAGPGQLTAGQILRLQKLLVQVWQEAGDDLERNTAATAGVNGILSNDDEALYRVLDSFSSNAMLRGPIVVSHRGLSNLEDENGELYNENTVRAARAAYDRGGADAVEIDIHLTTDGRAVVMHDDTIARTTNGSGNVETMTSEQLKLYQVNSRSSTGDPIPLLDDFFQEFQGDDLIFYVEIKSTKEGIITALKDAIEEYGMSGRVAVISFHTEMLEKFRRACPEISVGVLNSSLNVMGSDYTSALRSIKSQTGALNATFHPSYEQLDGQLISQISARGIEICTWTYRSQNDLLADYTLGYGSYTTDYPDWLAETAYRIEARQTAFTCREGGTLTFPVTVYTRDGGTYTANANVTVLSGALRLEGGADGYSVADFGEATVLFYVREQITDYYVYSSPIQIRVEQEAAGGGCGGCQGAAGLLGAAALGMAVLLRRR